MSPRARQSNQVDRRLAAALTSIEQKFGVGTLQRLGSAHSASVEVLPTGLAGLVAVLGVQGWPRGRIIEVFGHDDVGVTTLLLHAMAAAQYRGGLAALIDADQVFDPEYARRVGCYVEEVFVAGRTTETWPWR